MEKKFQHIISIPTNAQITLFKSLFHCREDVFALRWEKEKKSGYMPAYSFDPYRYRVHKMNGGTFQNYPDKSYLPLTDNQILKHLNGEQLMGIYPLLKDNTSWFIAADFDEEKWAEECKLFIKYCNEKGIPAYLERSRSGKGGHIWIFFEQSYPSVRSRKIIISLLQQSGIFSVFDKGSSFDRLFPNQDFLSGKGFGNLIALPLQKQSLEQGNSCFIDAETLQPYSDQWNFLKTIRRISIAELGALYHSVSNSSVSTIPKTNSGKLAIALSNVTRISRNGMTTPLINFLKEELNFTNTEFIIKKKIGKNTWGTERYFKFVEEMENDVVIPKGMIGRLLRFCKEQKIDYAFQDERNKLEAVSFSCSVQLREHQKTAIAATSKKEMGVIVAPPGSGKTVIGLKIIVEKQQPALIIVHRKQLAEQWIERIQAFLGIPKNEIGTMGRGKNKIAKRITVAMIQSLSKELKKNEVNDIQNAFGTIIVDECHHIPAETFRDAISKLNTFYLYGLTATPFRKYNDGKLIFIHLGEVIAEIKPQDAGNHQRAKIIIRNTELDIPFNSKTDKFETLSKILVHDSTRNKLILEDITGELSKGKKAVIITERKEHIDTLYQYLKQSYETISLSGEDSEANRSSKWKILKEGNYQVLIATGQFFGEGTDLQNAQCLFLVYPFSFQGKLIQYIGRVQRSEEVPVIYDYRDYRIDYLNKLFLKRNTYYRKLDQYPSLFDEPEDETTNSKNIFIVEQKIKMSIEELEFRYGTIAFRYKVPEMNTELDFEIENLEIRPEFDVLKPYFSKLLKSKKITIDIHAEFESKKLISQLATSENLEKINREIIEGVRFRFVANIIRNTTSLVGKENLLDLNQIQSDGENKTSLFHSEEELLEDILKNKNVKHYQQLRYLAQKHDDSILKIRFVLNPFSFVFLLTGKEQFHMVLETLDTEEATYLWHFNKDKRQLPLQLKQVDQHLNMIRNKGREDFLKSQPENFSRIIHDYSDERKGFIIWKDLLEERSV